MILQYFPCRGAVRPRIRRVIWLLTFCIVIGLTISWLSRQDRILQIQAAYWRSRLASIHDNKAKVEIISNWAKLVTKRGKPELVFAIIPKSKRQQFYGGTYSTVEIDGTWYLWAGKSEAGLTPIRVDTYIDIIGIGAGPWPDVKDEYLAWRREREATQKR